MYRHSTQVQDVGHGTETTFFLFFLSFLAVVY